MTGDFVSACLAALSGLAIGLLLNLCADRLPGGTEARGHPVEAGRGSSGLRPCPADAPRLPRWAILLLLSTALCVHLQGRYGWSLTLIVQGAYCSLLLLIAAIDLEHRLVPNVLVLVGLGLAFVFNIVWALPGVGVALWGAAIGGGTFLALALAQRNALGLGDVKLAFLIGMMTGFPWVLQALILGILLGGLAAGLLLLLRLRGPKQYMPYAPYLVAGAMITLLYGPHVAGWYARLTGLGG